MPTEPVAVKKPYHPLYALTTFELRDYRRELEKAIAFFDQQDPVPPARDQLQARLGEVLAELASARRELAASLTLSYPDSPIRVPNSASPGKRRHPTEPELLLVGYYRAGVPAGEMRCEFCLRTSAAEGVLERLDSAQRTTSPEPVATAGG